MSKPTTLASILPPVRTAARDALDAELAAMSAEEYAGWCLLHNDAIEQELEEGLTELHTLGPTTRMD